jgi:hypothetical protein
MKNGSIVATYEHSILSVRLLENARVEVEDLKELYDYGNMWAHGKPYCVLFEAVSHYEISEDAIEYMSAGNTSDSHILAKAYVVGENKESQLKTKAHILFDHPLVKPSVFKTHEDARKYLNSCVNLYNNSTK